MCEFGLCESDLDASFFGVVQALDVAEYDSAGYVELRMIDWERLAEIL
jgi:hypothetical protein